MINRRAFIGGGIGSVAALLASRSWAETAQPPRIGVQLYTFHEACERDLPGTLKRVASIGCREVELYSLHGRSPAEMKNFLAENGLNARVSHFSYDSLVNSTTECLDNARALGLDYVVMAWAPPERRSTLDDFRRMADQINRIGTECRNVGLRFAYHNNDYEFAKKSGVIPYDLLLDRTDTKLVKLEMDVYWVIVGGRDPMDYLVQRNGRYTLLHAKDRLRGSGKGDVMTAVGKGTINWTRILKAAHAQGMEAVYVDLDTCDSEIFECTATSLKALDREM